MTCLCCVCRCVTCLDSVCRCVTCLCCVCRCVKENTLILEELVQLRQEVSDGHLSVNDHSLSTKTQNKCPPRPELQIMYYFFDAMSTYALSPYPTMLAIITMVYFISTLIVIEHIYLTLSAW